MKKFLRFIGLLARNLWKLLENWKYSDLFEYADVVGFVYRSVIAGDFGWRKKKQGNSVEINIFKMPQSGFQARGVAGLKLAAVRKLDNVGETERYLYVRSLEENQK